MSLAQRNPDILFSAYEDPASQSYPDLTLTIMHTLQAGYRFSASKVMCESVSERASVARSRVRESISRRRGTLSGRLPRGAYEGAVKKNARTSFARPEKKSPEHAAAKRGDVTRRKKGARAKREVVNLGPLIGKSKFVLKKLSAASEKTREREQKKTTDAA